MDTSLAQQLKKLAVPQTTLLFQDRVKVSFLFDPSTVANLSRDEIYDIGITGLQELSSIQNEFEIFEQTLFSETSKHFERSCQTAEVNAKLDSTIDNFLTLLSPYFLLRPAHKALEWLVCRYHIHMFNTDSLISCILPYHETRHFVRALQMVDLGNPAGRWHWLKPLQKPGVPLSKLTLFTHAYDDLSFLKFICEMVPKATSMYKKKTSCLRITISFYVSTVLGALENIKKITETLIATLLPFIFKGLKSELRDYRAASFMIICQLVRKTNITPSLLKEFVINITKNLKSLTKEAAVCLLIIYQHQQLKEFPKRALLNIKKYPEFVKTLAKLDSSYSLTTFLIPLLQELIKSSVKAKLKKKGALFKILNSILNNIDISDNVVTEIIKTLLGEYNRLRKKRTKLKINIKVLTHIVSTILLKLEKRYSEEFDRALENYIQSSPKKCNSVQKLLCLSFSEPKHNIFSGTGVSLFIGVNHLNDVVRTAAVKTFITNIQENQITDEDFIKDTVISRLEDNCPEIVYLILSLDKILYEMIAEDVLYTKILKLLNEKHNTNQWFQVHRRAVHIACNFPFNDDRQNKWLAIIFSHLLPKNAKGLKIVKVIMSSVLSKNNPLLQNIQNATFLLNDAMTERTLENLLKLNCRIIEIIGSLLLNMNHLQRQILLDNLKSSVNLEGNAFVPLKLMVGLLLHFLISRELDDVNYQLCLSLDTIRYVELLLPLCKTSPFKEELSLQDVITCWIESKDHQLPSELIIFCLSSLMQNIKSETLNLKNQWLQISDTPFCLNKYHTSEKLGNWTNWNVSDVQDYYQCFLLQLFKIITEQANLENSPLKASFQELLKTFLKSYLSDAGKQLLFLSSLWSTHLLHPAEDEEHTCSILQIRSLVITGATIFKPEELDQLVFGDNSIVFPSLLIALISSLEEIREAALNVLGKMTENYKAGSTVYFAMTHKILQKCEEIQSDNEQLSNMISEWYESSTQQFKTRRSLAVASMVLKPILQQIINIDTPDYIKHGLLLVLKETNSKEIISVLLPLLKSKLEAVKEKSLSSADFAIIHLLMLKYSPLTVDLMTSVDSDIYLIFDEALKITKIAEEKDTRIQEIAVSVLTKDYFGSIPSQEVQQKILSDLTDLYLNSESADTKRLLHKTLRKLLDNASLMVNELQKFEKTTASTTLRETKRLRVQQSEMLNKPEILEEQKWKKIIIMLEIIENKKKIKNIELLFPVLFDLLNRSLEIENHPSVEYLRQVTLSSLQNCCELLENVHLDERKFQVEIVVQCIRISNNPQTQNQALIVLNMAAKLFPEHVLHNIMTIFTFMGASLVRQDTSYSFQVISQTVETVIPALLQATSQKQDDDILQVVGNLTRVFIDALPDIPEHRRQPLFTKLLLTLGSEKFLWLILCQVFEICVRRKIKDDDADQGSKMPSSLTDFSMLLCQHFPVDVQLNACIQMTNYLLTLPDENEFETKKRWQKVSLEPFDIKNHTINQLKYFKYNTVSFMISLLSSQAFVGQVVEMNRKKKKLDKLYEKMMELTLQYIQKIAHLFQVNKENSNLKFWKAFLHKLYDLLDKVNSLLPSQRFISVVKSLMRNKLSPVRHKAMEMLSAKLLHQSEFFSTDDYPALLTLVRPLLNILKKKLLETSEASEDTDLPLEISKNDRIINSQIAFYCLKLLCRILGSSNPEAFVKVLKIVTKVLENPSVSYQLTSSALLCLAELCSSLGIHVLPFLVDFMPPLISILQDLEVLNSNSLLLISTVTTVQHLTEHLCSFLSTYMDQLLTQVCIICATTSNTDGQNASLHQRLNTILEHLAVTVPLRILLPSIVHCYENVTTTHYKAIESLIFIFTKKITSIEKSEFNSYLKNLQVFFYLMFEFRCTNTKLPLTEIDRVEQHVINAFGIMVSKLSETTFRPMFFKLYDWATTPEEIDRILIFYKITENLSERLKSLFILFTGHFIKNAALLLDNNNVSKTVDTYFHEDKRGVEKSCCLLKYIFNTLYKCFLYDNEKFVDKSIFNIIMQPLVDQIENVMGTEEDYQDRITNCVSPCIAQFSVAIGDSSLWKSLNYQIMLKTRHNSSKIRFATLHVLHEVVKKLGEGYLTLLPESIPFLAELMEDESPEVEKQCQSVLLDMEKILGEPLMKYFV